MMQILSAGEMASGAKRPKPCRPRRGTWGRTDHTLSRRRQRQRGGSGKSAGRAAIDVYVIAPAGSPSLMRKLEIGKILCKPVWPRARYRRWALRAICGTPN